jgi:hypothetical protein
MRQFFTCGIKSSLKKFWIWGHFGFSDSVLSTCTDSRLLAQAVYLLETSSFPVSKTRTMSPYFPGWFKGSEKECTEGNSTVCGLQRLLNTENILIKNNKGPGMSVTRGCWKMTRLAQKSRTAEWMPRNAVRSAGRCVSVSRPMQWDGTCHVTRAPPSPSLSPGLP